MPKLSMPAGMVLRSPGANKDLFQAEDGDNPNYYITGTLAFGVVNFEVVAVVGERRGQWSGREFFTAMLAHFGIRRIKKIAAHWSDARPELRTNLDIFNRETAGGATKQAAAFATHTGRWCQARGFSVIVALDTTPDDFPGGYEQVLVEFGKPLPRPRKKKDRDDKTERRG